MTPPEMLKALVEALRVFCNESVEIEHDSFSMQGHEYFDPKEHIEKSNALLTHAPELLKWCEGVERKAELEKAYIDQLIHGYGAYIQNEDGSVKHVPASDIMPPKAGE